MVALGGGGRLQWERLEVDHPRAWEGTSRRRRLQSAVTAVAAVSLFVAAAFIAHSGHTANAGPERVEMDRGGGWQALKTQARHVRLMPHAEKVKERTKEMNDAINHLSSSELVQRAAAACAQEAKCVPTVDELVKRAASACSNDPSCVCDWGRYPKQCFLSEVQRHKQLKRDAKTLVRQINARAATDKVKKTVVSELEHEEESFESVLQAGRKAIGAGDFEAGKTALAKAEYLHEVAARETGDINGPVMERQERSLKHFARKVVEAEAEDHSRREARSLRDEGARGRRRRGESKGISEVEQQIKALSSNVEKLMHKVGTMAQKKEMKRQMAAAGVVAAGSTPKSQVQQLVKEIAVLTGKLDTAHDATGNSDGAGPKSAAMTRFNAEALAHQESDLTEAIARGYRAAFDGKMSIARMALHEARYYHSEIVRLKGEPRAAPCHPCAGLERTMLRVRRNGEGRGEEAHARPREEHDEVPRALRGREQELVQGMGGRDAHYEEDGAVAGAVAEEAHKSTARIESDFDEALSRGERARVEGKRVLAAAEEEQARAALAALEERELPHGDKLVKKEMADALGSFAHGVEKMPRSRREEERRRGAELAARVAAEARRHKEGDEEARKQAAEEKQAEHRHGVELVDHLLYGKYGKHEVQAVHHTAATVASSKADGGRHEAGSRARGRELRRVAAAVDAQREHGRRREWAEHSASARGDARGRAAMRHAVLRREVARRRLRERKQRGRWGGEERRERDRRDGDERREERRPLFEGRHGEEERGAYREQSWEQAPLPKRVLSQIYGHFSRS